MTKKIKIFVSLFLCCLFVFLTSCSSLTTSVSPEKQQQSISELVNSAVLLHPATNEHFRYNVYNTYIRITQCLSNEKNIEIPDTIEGLPVLVIGDSAFINNTKVETIKLGKHIAYIDYAAFAGCRALKSINLPESLMRIGESVFSDCVSLKQIDIPPEVLDISPSAFYNCTSLEKVVIEEAEHDIEKYILNSAFYNCCNLTFMWLPNTVTIIEENAFTNVPSNLTIYSYSKSFVAEYCAQNFINFSVLDRQSFENVAILSNKVSIPQYLSVGETLTTDVWNVTLNNFKEYSTIGKYKPQAGNVFLVLNFNITNLSSKDVFLNYLDINTVISGYSKQPVMLDVPEINGATLLSGWVQPHDTIAGYLIYEVNENWIYAYCDFSNLAGFENYGKYETRLAVYPDTNTLSK